MSHQKRSTDPSLSLVVKDNDATFLSYTRTKLISLLESEIFQAKKFLAMPHKSHDDVHSFSFAIDFTNQPQFNFFDEIITEGESHTISAYEMKLGCVKALLNAFNIEHEKEALVDLIHKLMPIIKNHDVIKIGGFLEKDIILKRLNEIRVVHDASQKSELAKDISENLPSLQKTKSKKRNSRNPFLLFQDEKGVKCNDKIKLPPIPNIKMR